MKSEDIYIKFSDNSVKRMKDIILQSKISEQYADENFFYLYSSVNFSPELRLKLISFLKTKCNEMSSKLISLKNTFYQYFVQLINNTMRNLMNTLYS